MVRFEQDCRDHIKQKKELAQLDDQYVLHVMADIPAPDFSKYSSFTQALRSKKVKEYIRTVRAKLRTVYGLFVTEPVTPNEVSTKDFSDEFVHELLQRHRSTAERVPYYQQFYRNICDVLEKHAVVSYRLLDIACGYNPFALQYFTCAPKEYVAVDLSSNEMSVIDTFFKTKNMMGTAFGSDVLSDDFMNYLEKEVFDVVFLLKALDSFETVKRHSSKKLLVTIQAKLLIVSFPLVSIGGGASISQDRRGWFERFCEKEGWEFSTFALPNELVYIVIKGGSSKKV